MPSHVIRSFAYDAEASRLDVQLLNGRGYSYHEVPPQTFEAMKRAFAKGEFFNRHIRGKFTFTRLE